jgi:mRNA-degrading endonuclease toxin of MazEF toxin-antitoxin module
MKEQMKPQIGDVYIIVFGRYKRPAIILSDTGFACMVAPLTTKHSDGDHLLVQVQNYNQSSEYVDIRKLTIVSKQRLKGKIGSVDANVLAHITNLIKTYFDSGFNSFELNSFTEQEMEKRNVTLDEYLSEGENEPQSKRFDIFLSHSSLDKAEIAGIAAYFQNYQYEVYVDSFLDPHLKPSKASRETAQIMRNRMSNSKTLLFVFSKNSHRSVWMPWELGYFDGMARSIAILPIEQVPFFGRKFKGQEYLDLYDYIEKGSLNMDDNLLNVITHNKSNMSFRDWHRTAT